MYYCPCPCRDLSDPDLVEETAFIALPRNLSYVQESYLDEHSVSGRFVYNPQTDRRIAVSANSNGVIGTPPPPTATTAANTSTIPSSLNHHHHLHHHNHYYNGYVSSSSNTSNGVGGNGGGIHASNGITITTNIITTTTTTTASATCSTPTPSRWRADGTKVEFFEKESRANNTGKLSSSRDFESRRENIKEVNKSNEGEGDTEGEQIRDEEKYLLSVVKSRRDPTIHFGSDTALNWEASNFQTNSSVLIQAQSQRGADSMCNVGVNNNSCSSECSSGNVCDSDSVLISQTNAPIASLQSSSTSLPSKSHVRSTSSTSKPSFISRVTSLLSPKDETTTSVNPTQDVLDIGSSVDSDIYSDGTSPSQSLLLRSPDRSGLIMDRGEDIITPSSSQHDERSSLLACPSRESSANCISESCGPDVFLDERQSSIHDGKGDVDNNEEEVIIIEYEHGSSSVSDPTRPLNDDDKSKSSSNSYLETTQNSFSPPEFYNETLESIGLLRSESDKLLIQTQASSCESPPPEVDSDAFSEEGVFVNMIDDADTLMETYASEVSDDTCFSVDSMFCSPDDIDPADEERARGVDDDLHESSGEKVAPRRMSLEEAISKAASDFNKMSMLMYPDVAGREQSKDITDGQEMPSTSKTWNKSERLKMLSRGSPVHGIPALNIHITSSSDLTSSELDLNGQDRLDFSKESPIYEDHEFNFNKKTLRKSSSLKTNKTPPGTPHRKKVVRFADAMGLDLESVRHVLNTESPPKIPASAMADLKQGLSEERVDVGSRYLTACFTQPGATNDFVNTVLNRKVRLENAIITDLTITGFIRVANIAFHKSVRVRYTHNNWATFHDIAASYIQGSCDGPTDRFSFSIVAPAHFVPGNRLEFALSYNAEGAEYWDSNDGNNYVFECFAKTVPTENDREWLHFL